MYEMNPKWAEFYAELKPEKRKKILAELTESVEDDGANAFRRKLFDTRHVDPKDPKHTYDLFLMQCAFLPSLYRKRKFFLSNSKKEIQRSAEFLCLNQMETYTDAEKDALYWELRNTARRYFKTCQGGKYGSRLLGFSKASEDEKTVLCSRDAWQMTEGVARYAEIESQMSIFCDAVRHEFYDYFEDGQEIFERTEQKCLIEEKKHK